VSATGLDAALVVQAARLDVRELCGLAARVVTRAYRLGLPGAVDIDDAHGRIVDRTNVRGVIAADDPDVVVVLAGKVRLDRAEQAADRQEQRRRATVAAADHADEERRRRARSRLHGRPTIGLIRSRLGVRP